MLTRPKIVTKKCRSVDFVFLYFSQNFEKKKEESCQQLKQGENEIQDVKLVSFVSFFCCAFISSIVLFEVRISS